jgi:hypothetical protein
LPWRSVGADTNGLLYRTPKRCGTRAEAAPAEKAEYRMILRPADKALRKAAD